MDLAAVVRLGWGNVGLQPTTASVSSCTPPDLFAFPCTHRYESDRRGWKRRRGAKRRTTNECDMPVCRRQSGSGEAEKN